MSTEELYKLYADCLGRVTTDSRTVEGGEIFFAIRGENFDGNDYALKALGAGASLAVVNEDAKLSGSGLIPVPDPFKALQDLAVWHRCHVCGGHLPLIGLTGTNGKTTTKELIAAVLRRKYTVAATEGNLNNDLGVPLSLLKIRPDTEIAVIEMGASHQGDIAKLVELCRPGYGLITNVGKAHLLGFGSFEGVKAAKGELYQWLGSHEGSRIFLNMDDPELVGMARGVPCHVWGYGLRYQGAGLIPADSDNPFLALRLSTGETVQTQLVGAYNAANVLAALAIGEYFGVRQEDAIAAVEAYEPANKRSQLQKTAGNTLIVDAYNANPSSMAVAIDNLATMQAGSKLALLGDMRELGANSVGEHESVLRRLLALRIPCLLAGEEFGKALGALGLKADESGLVKGWFPDSRALSEYLAGHAIKNATVLVKGSRGMMMENVLPFL